MGRDAFLGPALEASGRQKVNASQFALLPWAEPALHMQQVHAFCFA
jgi:hypothetical protein